MPRAPVGTTKGTHGDQTDSDETIPDGGRRYVRVRWQALYVTARLLQPLHRSREALLNPCIIHHHEDERNHGQTRYNITGIFRHWTAVLMLGHLTICKHMGIRPLDIQSPIPTVEWIGGECRADCEEDRNEGNGIDRDPYIALLEYRTTPISDCGKSPAQLLMSRCLRYIIPSTPASLQPVLVNPEDIQLRFEEKQDKQNTVYDRNARTRAGISVGD